MPIKRVLAALSVLRRLTLVLTLSISKSLQSIWLLSLCHSRTEISRDFNFCIYFQGIISTLCLTHLFSLGKADASEVGKFNSRLRNVVTGHYQNAMHSKQCSCTALLHKGYFSLTQQAGFPAWEKDGLSRTNKFIYYPILLDISNFVRSSHRKEIGNVNFSF